MGLSKEIKALRDEIVEYRRRFHMYPEVSNKEYETANFIVSELEKMGVKVVKQGTQPQEIVKEIYTNNDKKTVTIQGESLPGVVGLIEGKYPGKTVAIRADMDALAVEEKNDVPYRSKKQGVMHACGHDAHMAMALGVAAYLSKQKDQIKGNVKLIFQPAEEYVGGAVPMIRDGVLENPKVDAIFGLHMDPGYKTGEIGISYGETMASSDRLIIKIKGKSTHGASPHQGIDAVVIAGQALVAMQAVMSRMKSPLESGVLSFGTIHGGEQPNSIAEEVVIRGILRTFKPEVREKAIEDIYKVLKGVTEAFGGSFEFTREKSYDSLCNDKKMVEFLKETAKDIIGEENIKELEKPRTIVEDFAYYLQEVPGAFMFLGTGNEEKDSCHPLHSSQFNIDEDSLEIGVAIMSAVIMKYLNQDFV